MSVKTSLIPLNMKNQNDSHHSLLLKIVHKLLKRKSYSSLSELILLTLKAQGMYYLNIVRQMYVNGNCFHPLIANCVVSFIDSYCQLLRFLFSVKSSARKKKKKHKHTVQCNDNWMSSPSMIIISFLMMDK